MCEEGLHYADLLDAQPTQPFEYASLRMRLQPGPAAQELETWGTPCDGAENRAECEASLASADEQAAFTETGPCLPICVQQYLVTTHRGNVQTWSDRSEILTLLGPIDTPSEAVFIASYDTFGVWCAALDPSLVTETERGYEMQATVLLDTCPVRSGLTTIRVERTGSIATIKGPEPIPSDSRLCI